MASVGAQTVDIIRGMPPRALKDIVELWRRVGIDGYGAQLLGEGDSAFHITVVQRSTEVGVRTIFNTLQGYQGTIVTIIDNWPVTYTNCLIVRVGEPTIGPDPTNLGARGVLQIAGVITS